MTLTVSEIHETRFPAMGSDVHVIVVDAEAALCDVARSRIQQLESRWSRFLPESELCRLNRAAGRPVLVSSDTQLAVATAIDAWRATDGRYDPTVLPALVAAGYDRDFALMLHDRRTGGADAGAPDHAATNPAAVGSAPGCAGITIDATVGAITLPVGVAIDLGGIGKGLAADIVATELLSLGAAGACVNVGGDLRVHGVAPTAASWVVGVEALPDLRIALADGAVATSSSRRRRWSNGATPSHHLIDPRSGRPAEAGLVAVTVIAGAAARAEMLTKAAFVDGVEHGSDIVERAGATGLLVTDTGSVLQLPGIGDYLR